MDLLLLCERRRNQVATCLVGERVDFAGSSTDNLATNLQQRGLKALLGIDRQPFLVFLQLLEAPPVGPAVKYSFLLTFISILFEGNPCHFDMQSIDIDMASWSG